MSRVSGMSGDFPARLPDWSAGGLLRCSAARLSVCRFVLQSPRAPTHTTYCGQVASILVRHVRHSRFPRDMLPTSSRGCHEDATRKLLRCNLSLCLRAPRHPSFICLRSGVGRCQMSTRCQWRIHQVRIAPSLVTASLNVGAALQGTEVSVQYETREPSTG